MDPDTASSYLDTLTPTLRRDYVAVVEENTPPSEQASDRGVNTSTVCTNVKRATKRLMEEWRAEQATPASQDQSSGYDVELVPVGGSEPDGTPTTIGKFTFKTKLVRDRVCDHLKGKILNACAGETILPHQDTVRNDINGDRPALDSNYDVTETSDKFPDRGFDTVIFDPPFYVKNSERHYEGWHVSEIAAARDELTELVAPGGVLIEFGWSSHSVSSWDGWEPDAIYLFQRGPTIPDVFMTVDRKIQYSLV